MKMRPAHTKMASTNHQYSFVPFSVQQSVWVFQSNSLQSKQTLPLLVHVSRAKFQKNEFLVFDKKLKSAFWLFPLATCTKVVLHEKFLLVTNVKKFVLHVSSAFSCLQASKSFFSICAPLFPFFTISCTRMVWVHTICALLSFSALAVASSASFGGRKNIKLFFFISFMQIFATEQIAPKFGLSLLVMESFLRCTVESRAIPLRTIVDVLKTKIKERMKRNFIFWIAITAPPLLRKAGTEKACKIFWASTAVQTYADSDVRGRECCFRLFWEKVCCWHF